MVLIPRPINYEGWVWIVTSNSGGTVAEPLIHRLFIIGYWVQFGVCYVKSMFMSLPNLA